MTTAETNQLAARQCEALLLQRIHEQSLQLPAEQLARVDDMDLCPATLSRDELIEFLTAPPSDFWAGYGWACLVYLTLTKISAVPGREF